MPPSVIDLSAASAVFNVSTLTSVSDDGATFFASAQSPAGARNTVAPASTAPAIFCWTPPTGPTWPNPSIVPVAATVCPPVNEPGVSLSTMPSVNARPALGPPTSAGSMPIFTVGLSKVALMSRSMPMTVRLSSADMVRTCTVRSLPLRVMSTESTSPGACEDTCARTASASATSWPSIALMTSPACSTLSAGASGETSAMTTWVCFGL